MSWRVIVRPKAEADLREAAHWYESQRANLGHQFLDEISEALHLLEITPERQPLYYRSFRRIQTRRFHYKIFYIIEADDVIQSPPRQARSSASFMKTNQDFVPPWPIWKRVHLDLSLRHLPKALNNFQSPFA